jgi:hypothetical protein
MGIILESRALTLHELELVRWLIEHSDADQGVFKSQLSTLTVASKCECGCPTIDFAHKGVAVTRKGERLIADYLATVEGMDVGVMLFESGGYLSTLEVYSLPGTNEPFGLPRIDCFFLMKSSQNGETNGRNEKESAQN